jgi:mannan endo-1,4-beta-mannosidase
MQIAPSKPMIIGEVASTESGGSKAQWITDMFAALPTRFPNIRGLLWQDKYEDGWDMPIETSPSSSAAFAAGVGSSAFSTNTFATLSASPIPAGG